MITYLKKIWTWCTTYPCDLCSAKIKLHDRHFSVDYSTTTCADCYNRIFLKPSPLDVFLGLIDKKKII